MTEPGVGPFTLLNVYFHEDWDVEAHTADQVLDEFIAANSVEVIREACSGARELDQANLSEDRLAERLEDLGLMYLPAYEGRTHREWLRHVLDRLTEATRC